MSHPGVSIPSWVARPILRGLRRAFEELFRQDTEQPAAFFRATRPGTGAPTQRPHRTIHCPPDPGTQFLSHPYARPSPWGGSCECMSRAHSSR